MHLAPPVAPDLDTKTSKPRSRGGRRTFSSLEQHSAVKYRHPAITMVYSIIYCIV